MSLLNRSSYLMIARLLPIVLILSAGFFWKYEKQIRIQAEKRLKVVSEQLAQTQTDLAEAKREADSANEEKRFLIQQLGDRDEHIRRLLAEMIKLLSGSGSVDLGEVLVRAQEPGAWDGVHGELRNIVSQNPIGGVAMTAPAAAGGLRQAQIETQAIPAAAQGAMLASAASAAARPVQVPGVQTDGRDGQILTVNAEHRFVVISQGSEDGLKQDSFFNVYFDGQKIGRIQIGTLYDRISTAAIVEGDLKNFREGMYIRIEPAS